MDVLLAVAKEEHIKIIKMCKSNEDEVCTSGHHFKPSSWDWGGARRKRTMSVEAQPLVHINENLVIAIPHKQPNHSDFISVLSKQESPSNPNWKRIKHSVSMLFTPDLPIQFKDKIKGMHGQDLKLVIQKKLSLTDMTKHFDCLSIPKGQMKNDFLTLEKNAMLQKNAKGRQRGFEVKLIESDLAISIVIVKKWKVGRIYPYMLNSRWEEVAKKH